MKKKMLALTLAAMLSAGVISGCTAKNESEDNMDAVENTQTTEETEPSAQETQTQYAMKAGTTAPNAHPYMLGLEKMDELFREKTDGALTLDVYGSSQLGSERDLIEKLQLGTLEMTCVSTAPLSGLTDAFLVFDLPFLFENEAQARAVMDSEVGTEILHSVDEQGMIGLGWFENGFRNITNNVRPIETPADLNGLKIRTMENPMHMDAFEVMGAVATPMAMDKVFSALEQNTIDGQENPIPIIETHQFDQVQTYLSMTGHLFSPAPVLMSKSYYDALPAEYQTAVQEAVTEAVAYEREQIDLQTESGLAALQERGMQVNVPDKAAFQEATASIYDECIKEGPSCVSPDIYQRVLDVIASVPSSAQEEAAQ